jgi:hypothetical protein
MFLYFRENRPRSFLGKVESLVSRVIDSSISFDVVQTFEFDPQALNLLLDPNDISRSPGWSSEPDRHNIRSDPWICFDFKFENLIPKE